MNVGKTEENGGKVPKPNTAEKTPLERRGGERIVKGNCPPQQGFLFFSFLLMCEEQVFLGLQRKTVLVKMRYTDKEIRIKFG
jgi:hypothetical protein